MSDSFGRNLGVCTGRGFRSLFSTTLLSPSMARARAPYSNRDSNSIRASVYDVFLELGALDENSRVADWIFTDPSSVLPDPQEAGSRLHQETLRFADNAGRVQGLQGVGKQRSVEVEERNERRSRPPSSKSFGLKFSPKRSKTRSKASSTSSGTRSPGEGYETDEGYVSASPNSPKSKSRVRAVFSLQSIKSAAAPVETSTKPLPSLPPIRERLNRTESSSSVAKTKSLFRKRPKSPTGTHSGDELQQWHEVSALTPRVFNPSADNGVPLAPPSSFKQLVSTSRETERASRHESLTFALPRSIFRSISVTKQRVTPRARPRSLNLVDEPSPRFATSLPSSPFILVTEGEGAGGTSAGPLTPFVFVSSIDNPTPLNSARRFSDVTSMTAPIYPLSISRTLRRSMVFDKLEPSFPRLRPSSSYSSLQDVLAASAASPYDLYNQPIPGIQRGKEAPFPSRPVLPQPLSSSTPAGESRMATIQRYREFSEQLVELTPYKRFAEMEMR
ncbi:hypothetical protein C8R43DRAFT_993953 [Mycena crocata]|nr:hypothetical protein C8R43DRAFT_993953 [Mycena crocata]